MTVRLIASCMVRTVLRPEGGDAGLWWNCLTVSATWWRFSVTLFNMCVLCQELEKPSPPQKPLPADPRNCRLVRSPSGVQGHNVVQGPSAVCGTAPVRGVPTPLRPIPHPKKWVKAFQWPHLLKYYFYTSVSFVSPSCRPSSKQPPTLPKPCIIANIKYSSWDFGGKDKIVIRH